MTEAGLQILLALAGGEKHGYAIMGEIAERTEGRIKLYPGTLYANIKRLVDSGLLEEIDGHPAEGGDERRRYYRLTRQGRAAARAEIDRLSAIVRSAPAALKGVR